MAQGHGAPKHAVVEIGETILHLVVGVLLLPIACALITLIAVRRESLVDTALQERALLAHESFPANLARGWLMYAPTSGPEIPRSTPVTFESSATASTDFVHRGIDRAVGFLDRWVQGPRVKYAAYGCLLVPRLCIVAGLLPGLLAILVMAWMYGSYLNARWANAGQPFSTNALKLSRWGFSLSCGLLLLYLGLPIIIPSTCLLIPMAGMVVFLVLVRRNRA